LQAVGNNRASPDKKPVTIVCLLDGRGRAHVHPLSLTSMDAQDLDRLVTRRAEPMR
jgi:hypothetical protein